MGKSSAIILLISFTIIFLYNQYAPHIVLKRDTPLENHPSYIFNQVFDEQSFKNLQQLAKNTTFSMTLRADNNHENMYGSETIGKNGKCTHKYRHSSEDGTKCVVPARIDVAKHLLFTGGWGAKKESYEKLVGRGKFFQNFWADFNPEHPEIMPEVANLLEQEDYQKEAHKICRDQKYLDPMQASILINIPGQEVGMHADTPWFYGADRKTFPIWLLTAMRLSTLYDDIAINQVQGVAYLHEWNNPARGGGFYFYDKGPAGDMTLVDAVPNRGLIVDGTVLLHGTQTFRPDYQPVFFDKDIDYQIKFNEETQLYDVFNKETKEVYKSYNSEEVRISLVWRQRCFKDEEDFKTYKQKNETAKQLDMHQVINRLLDNLIEKGQITTKPTEEIEIISVILDNYIKMPYPENSIFPYNYCLLSKIAPFTKPLIDLLC